MWLATAVALSIAAFLYFSTQLGQLVFGVDGDNSTANEATLDDTDLARVTAVQLQPEIKGSGVTTQAPTVFAVSDLRVIAMVGTSATVGFRLTASPSTSDYPILRVYLQSGTRTVRTLDFSAQKYAHGIRLSDEQIRLPLELHPGETGFTAQPVASSAKDAQ